MTEFQPEMARSGMDRAGGAEGNRTPDLCSAIAALSHLSYSPAPSAGRSISRASPPAQRPPPMFPPLVARHGRLVRRAGTTRPANGFPCKVRERGAAIMKEAKFNGI